MSRRALLVLGMHRSGTSALAGALVRLGAQGPQHPIAGDKNNPLGYWESEILNEFHERLLQSAGSRWSDWTAFDSNWLGSQIVGQFEYEFRALVDQEFGGALLFVVKDPRICRFVPFWLRNLEAVGIAPFVIIPVRSPFEVAQSLWVRDGLKRERALLIWLRHVLDAEFDTRSVRRSFVRYSDLLDDWRRTVNKISADIGLTWPITPDSADSEISHFLSSELRHHAVVLDTADLPAPLSRWVENTWRAFDLLLERDSVRTSEAFSMLDQVRREFDSTASIFGPALESERAETRQYLPALEAEKREMQRVQEELEASRRDTAWLRGQMEAQNQQIERLHADADARTREQERLREQINNKDADNIRLAELHENELRHQRSAAATANQRIEALTNDLDNTRRHVEALLASGSWRVTAPLRAALRVLTRTQS